MICCTPTRTPTIYVISYFLTSVWPRAMLPGITVHTPRAHSRVPAADVTDGARQRTLRAHEARFDELVRGGTQPDTLQLC